MKVFQEIWLHSPADFLSKEVSMDMLPFMLKHNS